MLAENTAPEVGRTFQHVEDLVFIEGSAGAKRSLQRCLDAVAKPQTVRWKWDGKPTVYWGRDTDGRFMMTNNNGWAKTDGSGKTYSAREFSNFILNTGTGDRVQFADEFSRLWPLFEAATPESFRGFVYGDLMYMNRPQLQGQFFAFTPNRVTYRVVANHKLGQRVAASNACAVGHAFYPQFGQPTHTQQPIDDFEVFNKTPALVVLGPKHASTAPQINQDLVKSINTQINENAQAIDAFLDTSKLMAGKMSGLKNVIYYYNNQMAKQGKLQNLAEGFVEWLPQSKTSVPMQDKIKAWCAANPRGFSATFAIMENIRSIKDQLVNHFDKEPSEIMAQTGSEPGGEGYVMYHPTGNVKFVPRHRWTPS